MIQIGNAQTSWQTCSRCPATSYDRRLRQDCDHAQRHGQCLHPLVGSTNTDYSDRLDWFLSPSFPFLIPSLVWRIAVPTPGTWWLDRHLHCLGLRCMLFMESKAGQRFLLDKCSIINCSPWFQFSKAMVERFTKDAVMPFFDSPLCRLMLV